MITTDKLNAMTIEDFEKTYLQGEKSFDFSKFEIICKNCKSKNVEFGGITQEDDSGCYYPGDTPHLETFFVCKCHNCGNGFALKREGADID